MYVSGHRCCEEELPKNDRQVSRVWRRPSATYENPQNCVSVGSVFTEHFHRHSSNHRAS